jgi:hypothetical protein
MPASPRSLQVTSAYRDRLAAIRARLDASAAREWPRIDTLDGTRWAERVAQVLAGAQTEAVRASAGYLTAFLSTELGRRVRGPVLDSRAYAGVSRDGRPLTESLRSPLIGVLAALKDGKTPEEALATGWNRAQRMLEMDLMHAARESLREGIAADDRVEGWQRGVAGTCGACAGDVAVSVTTRLPSVPLRVHPNCKCVTVPVVTGVPNRVPLLTGQQLFERMSRDEQNEQFGEVKADALRAGAITLADLVATSSLETSQDFITEKPLDAAQ